MKHFNEAKALITEILFNLKKIRNDIANETQCHVWAVNSAKVIGRYIKEFNIESSVACDAVQRINELYNFTCNRPTELSQPACITALAICTAEVYSDKHTLLESVCYADDIQTTLEHYGLKSDWGNVLSIYTYPKISPPRYRTLLENNFNLTKPAMAATVNFITEQFTTALDVLTEDDIMPHVGNTIKIRILDAISITSLWE